MAAISEVARKKSLEFCIRFWYSYFMIIDGISSQLLGLAGESRWSLPSA